MQDHPYRKVVGGTYEYMAPEALRKELQGKEVDVWALGILLYELFHNKEPYRGKSTKDMYHSIQTKPLRFSRSVPEDARDLIYRLLEQDKNKRIGFRDVF